LTKQHTPPSGDRQAGAGSKLTEEVIQPLVEWVRGELWEWESSEESAQLLADRLVRVLSLKIADQIGN
jgi:hypothetical protein